MSEHLAVVLREMCDRVGADADKINFKSNDWFLKNEWTMKEQDRFKEWFIGYLWDNVEARKELLVSSKKNKKTIEKAVDLFLFDYGWRFKDTI